MIKVELNIEKFKQAMEEKQKKLKMLIPLGVRDATLLVHRQVKTSIAHGDNAEIAVDTGRFLNSVDFDMFGDSGRVFSDLEYAKFIEFGTSKMESRPHFRNTAFVLTPGIKEVMGNVIKDL